MPTPNIITHNFNIKLWKDYMGYMFTYMWVDNTKFYPKDIEGIEIVQCGVFGMCFQTW